MTTEEKWQEFDDSDCCGVGPTKKAAREAYKSALRKAILNDPTLDSTEKEYFIEIMKTAEPLDK